MVSGQERIFGLQKSTIGQLVEVGRNGVKDALEPCLLR
jgi:hypothetical protein